MGGDRRDMFGPAHERFALLVGKVMMLIHAKHTAKLVRNALLDHLNRYANASAAGDKSAPEIVKSERFIELHVKAIFGAHVRAQWSQTIAQNVGPATRQRFNDRAHERRQWNVQPFRRLVPVRWQYDFIGFDFVPSQTGDFVSPSAGQEQQLGQCTVGPAKLVGGEPYEPDLAVAKEAVAGFGLALLDPLKRTDRDQVAPGGPCEKGGEHLARGVPRVHAVFIDGIKPGDNVALCDRAQQPATPFRRHGVKFTLHIFCCARAQFWIDMLLDIISDGLLDRDGGSVGGLFGARVNTAIKYGLGFIGGLARIGKAKGREAA